MVFRTNVLDAYNAGQEAQVNDPDLDGEFPVYEYLIVDDDRVGDDHKPHGGLYYSIKRPFTTVRGKRVFNCRCTPRYVHRIEWADLQKHGAKVESE
jgi:uncharacterized protein with gpF-like domain